MAVINFTLDGVPMLYNGQEIGDTSPQSIYARWPVGWQAACLPKPAAKLAFHKKLCQLRRGEPGLNAGQTVWLDNDQPDCVVSFLRRAGQEEIVSIVNLSNRPLTVQVKLPQGGKAAFRNLLAAKPVSVSVGEGQAVPLGGFEYFVGKRQ